MEKTNEWATLPELKPMVTIEWEKLQILVRNQERLYAIVSGVEDYKTFDEITQQLAAVKKELDMVRIQKSMAEEKYDHTDHLYKEACKEIEALQYNYNEQTKIIEAQLEDIGNLKEEVQNLKEDLKSAKADYDKVLERNDKLEHLYEESERVSSQRADNCYQSDYKIDKLTQAISEFNSRPWWKRFKFKIKI